LLFRPIKSSYWPKYLYYHLQTPYFKKHIENTKSGTTFFGVSQESVSKHLTLLPTYSEQKAIATALSDVDALISSLDKLITKKNAIKQGAMQELLTPPHKGGKRLPGFCGEWEEKKLGDIGDVQMCKRIFSYQTTKRGDVPFFKIGTFGKEPDAFISWELYSDFRKKYPFPKKGFLLISASGTIGRTVEYNGEDAYYQDSNIIWIDNDGRLVTNEYLKYIFKVISYKTEGSTIKRLYNSIVKSAIFYCPPSLKEQNSIARILSVMDAEIDGLEMKKAKYHSIKQGMMQELLTGKTRLV
jgi:type I restriction enzyme S subunit